MKYVVCNTSELRPGESRLFQVKEKLSVLVLRTPENEFRAIYPRCPHQGAPLNCGELKFTTTGEEPGEYKIDYDHYMIHCPWHGFEFDTASGRCRVDSERFRIRAYRTTVENDQVVVEV